MIYEPHDDSFLLASVLKKYVFEKICLDMGSGSGYLALEALKLGAKSVLAIDKNPESIKLLKSFKLKKLRPLKSDLFSKVKGKFDIIICNPPYLPEDKLEDKESRLATTGGKEGDEFIVNFLNNSVKHLSTGGTIILLLSSLTPRKRIISVIKKKSLQKRKIAKKRVFMETLEVWEIRKSQ